MKELLNRLINNQKLSKKEAKEVLTNIAKGKYNQSQISAFLTIYLMRSISVEELEGFRDAMLSLCKKIDLSDFNTIDICGTGGDEKNTFNISTLSSFVVAGANVSVAKHGNYGVSSISGSSNVLEYFGVKFSDNLDIIKKSIKYANICFLHAPLFHLAMKNVAPIRKELGVKTFFNILGPLVNPAFPPNQLIGVFSLELARLYSYMYQKTSKHYAIIHSLDIYDEISLTQNFKLITAKNEQLISPKDWGFEKVKQEDLSGGKTIAKAAKIFENILNNEGTKQQKNTVIANAALGIATAEQISINEAIERAKKSLYDKNALKAFKKFLEVNS